MFVGVLTFNRKEYVQMHAMSLRDSMDIVPWGERAHLWVFDDQSTEYGEKELREWYPMAEKIIVNKGHKGEYVQSCSLLSVSLSFLTVSLPLTLSLLLAIVMRAQSREALCLCVSLTPWT